MSICEFDRIFVYSYMRTKASVLFAMKTELERNRESEERVRQTDKRETGREIEKETNKSRQGRSRS